MYGIATWTLFGICIMLQFIMTEKLRSSLDVSRSTCIPQVWRLLTAGFVHDGTIHLTHNLLYGACFFLPLEDIIGPEFLIALFFLTVIFGYTFSILTISLWSTLPGKYAVSLKQCGCSPATYGISLYFVTRWPNKSLGSMGSIVAFCCIVLNFIDSRRTENSRRVQLAFIKNANLPDKLSKNKVYKKSLNIRNIKMSPWILMTQCWTSAITIYIWSWGLTSMSWLIAILVWRFIQFFKVQNITSTAHAAHLGGALTGAIIGFVNNLFLFENLDKNDSFYLTFLNDKTNQIVLFILFFYFLLAFFESQLKLLFSSSWFLFPDMSSLRKAKLNIEE